MWEEMQAAKHDDWDVEAIEEQKMQEEVRLVAEGELLAAPLEPSVLPQHRALYGRERARLVAERKRRRLTGAAWERRVEDASGRLYWHNVDTGENNWQTPCEVLFREVGSKSQCNLCMRASLRR